MLQRKNLAHILKGKQAGKRALGFGRNKVRCHRAAKLALSITLALDHVDSAIVDTEFGDMLRRALTMRSRQLRNLASEGPEQKRGPAKRSLDHDSRADAVESAMSVSSSSMSSPTGVVYKPTSLDHEVRARVSSMSMPTRATIMTGL